MIEQGGWIESEREELQAKIGMAMPMINPDLAYHAATVLAAHPRSPSLHEASDTLWDSLVPSSPPSK
jgi:hypothetical protein